MKASKPRLRHALLHPSWVCFVWFGMTAGVSLLATPVKFSAPTLPRAVALDVGRVVFAALNKAELVALIILLAVTRLSRRSASWWSICAALALIVIAQSVWLLPELSARAEMVVSGIEPPASYLHATYSTLELVKLLLLLVAGFLALGEQGRSR